MFTDQSPYAVRFDWGERGLDAITPGCAVTVIVDVLSFCTCVDLAVARGAVVLPYRWKDDSARHYAAEQRAVLAEAQRTRDCFSLSPWSLVGIPAGTQLVLPSPNGATLSLRAAEMSCTIAACLRNAAAVAAFARAQPGPVAVIACGERRPDGTLRPAWEDLVGAGAVIAQLPGPCSPEAVAACDAFQSAHDDLPARLRDCASGRELIERGFADDIEHAAALGASNSVPVLDPQSLSYRNNVTAG
jgi:2-phosphosulfolactate phosphatase